MSGQTIALSLFLILLAIGVIIFLSILIIIKRTVADRKSRIGKIIYSSSGYGAPKVWKESVRQHINDTVKIRKEPRVLESTNSKNSEINTADRVLGFHFRAKTVDSFVDLKEMIMRSYPFLEAPPVRNVHNFLMSALKLAFPSNITIKTVESYCNLYTSARHDPSPYTEADFYRFIELHDKLLKNFVANDDSRSKSSKSTPRPTFLNAELLKLRNTTVSTVPHEQLKIRSCQPIRSTGDSLAVKNNLSAHPISQADSTLPFAKYPSDVKFRKVFGRHKPTDIFDLENVNSAKKDSCWTTKDTDFGCVSSISLTDGAVLPHSQDAIPTVISRTGSIQSDDSQTALICLNDQRGVSYRKREFAHKE